MLQNPQPKNPKTPNPGPLNPKFRKALMCLMAKVLIMTRQRGILLKDLLDQDRRLPL